MSLINRELVKRKVLTFVYCILRSIRNVEEVKYALQKELMVVPEVVTSGVGDFCDQASLLLLKSHYDDVLYFTLSLKDLSHFQVHCWCP